MDYALALSFIVIGYTRGLLKDAFLICSFTIIVGLVRFLHLEQYLYCTIVILIYAIHLKFTKSPIIKLSISILISYYLVSFILSSYCMTLINCRSSASWSLVIGWFNLYQYPYYSTILLIIAGLAKGNQGGFRNNSSSDNLLFDNYHIVNYLRIRSEFN